MEVLATGHISLVDINDAIVSDVPPADPSLGALWIDTTKDPNTLNSWDGTHWVEQSLSISALDPSFYQDVEKLKEFADKAGSDGIISSSEKANIKLILLEITGDVLSGQTLPTLATIDTAKGGQVYLARAEARASGMPITHADYTAFETAYSDLKTYLESLTPRPWLTGDTTIDPVTWTAKWDAYYEKLSRLAVATSTYLANSIRPGEDYNGVTINTDKGIVVLRGDGLFRTILNATEGISIEKNNAGTWNKMFYTNLDGKIYANGLVVSSDSTIAGTPAGTVTDNAAKGKAGIDELTSDLKVTPSEKTTLSREWEAIKAEYTQVLAQATALGVTTSTYTTSYTNLDGVTPKIAAEVLATMTTTYTFASASARDAFRTKINSYFAESEKIKKAINDAINKSASDANSKITNLQIGGRNLVTEYSDIRTLPPRNNGDAADNYNYERFSVDMELNKEYTVSAKVEFTTQAPNTDTHISIYPYPEGSDTFVPIIDGKVVFTFTKKSANTNSVLMYAGRAGSTKSKGVIFREIQIEQGNKATAYRLAPEAVNKLISDVDKKAEDSKAAIAEMTSDMKITPLEKNQLGRDWEAIKAEYTQVLALAQSTSGVSTTAYTTAYSNLDGVSPKIASEILVSMSTTYSFASAAARDLFKNKMNSYFSESEKIKKAISDAINKSANTANDKIDNLKIGGQNIVRKKQLVPFNAASSSFDDATNTWTITANDGAGGSWGAGLRITDKFSVIPIGSWYTASFDVYSPVDITWNNDTNNFPVDITSGTNDNDEVALRKNSGRNIKANTWTRCWFSYKNKDSSTTELYDQSNIGVVNNTGAPLTFKIRNVKGELGNTATDFNLAQADIEKLIADIQVGGNNIIPNSLFKTKGSWRDWGAAVGTRTVGVPVDLAGFPTGFQFDSTATGDYGYALDNIAVTIGETYTASAWFKLTKDGMARVQEGNSDVKWSYTNGTNTLNTWFRVVHTFVAKANSISIYFGQDSKYAATAGFVTGVQLERGNKATDWSLATQDINDLITGIRVGGSQMLTGTDFKDASGWNRWGSIGSIGHYAQPLLPTGKALFMETRNGTTQLPVPIGSKIGMASDGRKFAVKSGREYTLSMNVATSELGDVLDYMYLMYTVAGGNRRLGDIKTTDFPKFAPIAEGSLTNYYSVRLTFTADRDDDNAYILIAGGTKRELTGTNGYAWIRVNSLKIEEGNVATSWSLAQADIDKVIADADKKADDAKNVLAEMTSDMKITPLEKQTLSRDWEAIKAEYAQVLPQGQVIPSVSTAAYTTAYTNLDSVSPKIASEVLANMNTTYAFASAAARDLFKTQLNKYFDEAEKVKRAIAEATNDLNRELAQAISTGRMMYTDPIFKNGMNNVVVYNNNGAGGAVTVTRIAAPVDAPTTSSSVLEIKTTGAAAPSHGGFQLPITARAGAKFLLRIIAKIPVGYTLNTATNSMGTGYTDRILTSNKGTGKFEEYIRLVTCGTTGTFSSGGHFYLSGGATATPEAPVVWQVAYATVFDVGDADYTVTDNKGKWDDAANNANNALKQGYVVNNPTFADWTGAFPAGLGSWSSSTVSKETTLTRTGSAMRFSVGSDTAQIGATILPSFFINNLPNRQYYVVELDFMLVSGAITGACVLLDWSGMNPYRTSIHLSDIEPNPTLGKWYTVRAVMKRPHDNLTGYNTMQGFLLANYSGSTTNKIKNIVFDRLVFREPTQQEIDAYEITTIENGKTVIDGGKLKTNSVKAESVDARRLRVTNNSGTVTLEITNTGEVTVNGTVYINSSSMFAAGYDPSKNDGGRNILLNSRFSTADATSWNNWGSPSVRQIEDITDLPGFDKAVKFTTTANNQGLNQTVSVVAGNTYTVSCYAKSASGQPVLQIYDGSGYPSVTMKTEHVGKNQWVKLFFTFPAKTSTARIEIGKTGGGTLGTYWFTGIKLEEGDKTTGWTPANEDAEGLIGKVVTPNGDIKALDIASSMSVTPGAIDMVSKNINLKGKVTFSDFASGWALDSAGNKISNSNQPGYDPANPLYLDMDGNYRPLSDEKNFMSNLFTKDDTTGVTVIDGNYIKTGTIQAKYANFRDVQVYNDSGQQTFRIDTNGNLSTSGTSQSIGYERQKKGWKIDADGSAEFNAATFRGDIELGYYNAPTDSFVVTGGLLSSIGGTGKDLRFWAGPTKSTAPFKVFSDGTLEATKGYFTGTFSGEVVVGNISIRDTPTKGDAKIILTDDSKIQKVVLGESAVELNTKTTFGNFLTVDITNQKLDFGANDFGIDYKNNTIRMKSFSLKGTTALEFTSDGSSGDDFVFKNVTGDTSVRVDGSFIARDDIEITNVLRMKKSTDTGNKGIDYVFI
ncbi:carbohydrate binding domain-containing protein [Bacillus cereus group sp. N6]|uniref:phage head spike fiber domain-containing protein n=1 Tax=Bacillus cereus group sp. N6 TaxID=2794583 RepID=UPI001F5B3245|nr:carbohydrate binding domain-containing protein [Bacillus cereus group sp. N6]